MVSRTSWFRKYNSHGDPSEAISGLFAARLPPLAASRGSFLCLSRIVAYSRRRRETSPAPRSCRLHRSVRLVPVEAAGENAADARETSADEHDFYLTVEFRARRSRGCPPQI